MTGLADPYRTHPGAYDRMVSAEDADGELVRVLGGLVGADCRRVADLGAGTGRLSRILFGLGVEFIDAVDREPAMLAVAEAQLSEHVDRGEFATRTGDLSATGLATGDYDAVTEAWALAHAAKAHGSQGLEYVDSVVREMDRLARPGGHIVLVETLGLMTDRSEPPSDRHRELYRALEDTHRLTRTEIYTPFRFESASVAVEVCGFFFGPALSDQIQRAGRGEIPQWAGVWHRTVNPVGAKKRS